MSEGSGVLSSTSGLKQFHIPMHDAKFWCSRYRHRLQPAEFFTPTDKNFGNVAVKHVAKLAQVVDSSGILRLFRVLLQTRCCRRVSFGSFFCRVRGRMVDLSSVASWMMELQKDTRLVLQFARERNGGTRCWCMDVFDVVGKMKVMGDPLIHVLELDEAEWF